MKISGRVLSIETCDGFYNVKTDGAEVRIWFVTDDILRIRAGFDSDFDEASYSLVLTAWKSRTDVLLKGERKIIALAESSLCESDGEAVIQGRKLKLVIHKNPFFLSVYDEEGTLIHEDIPDLAYRLDSNFRRIHTSRIEEDDHFYGFGEKTGKPDKKNEVLFMSPGDAMGYDPAETDGLYKHIPFYVRLNETTGKASGYFYHNTASCLFNMGREKRNYWHRYASYTADAGDIDLFLINGPAIRDVIMRYTDLTGKSALLPKTAYGYLGSSMYYVELEKDCDDAILEFIDTAKEEDIPIDGFQMSSGYCAFPTEEGKKRYVFTWNHERFKDPAAWFAAMHERGIIVSANVKPGILLSHPLLEEMKEKGMFIKADEHASKKEDGLAVGTWWGGPGVFMDFTDPDTRKHWKDYLKSALLSYGCESIWNDNCEYDSLTDQDSPVSFEGKGGTIGSLRSVMANLMCMLSDEAIREQNPSLRPYSVCRAGHAGIQRYGQVWAGDNYTSWKTLQYNIATMLGMGISGVANNGCDAGGFAGPSPEPELFVRWVQNGIFMPRFSIHSVNTDNTVTEPWMYSGVKDLIKDAIQFRYALIPYLYSLAYRAHMTGLPIMCAEHVVFQHDPKTYEEGRDFLWGDHLLVSNVIEKGETIHHVYFPKGTDEKERWYDFFTREEYMPGLETDMNVTLSSIPLFVRSGAVIPMAENRMHNLRTENVTDLKILFAPDTDSTFVMYEDDGITNDYENGQYLKTFISVTSGTQTLIRFTHEGAYESTVKKVTLDVIHREKAPFFVTVQGRLLKQYLHRRKFEEAEEGWYYSQTLKSVLIRYPYSREDHEVKISFEEFDMIGM